LIARADRRLEPRLGVGVARVRDRGRHPPRALELVDPRAQRHGLLAALGELAIAGLGSPRVRRAPQGLGPQALDRRLAIGEPLPRALELAAQLGLEGLAR